PTLPRLVSEARRWVAEHSRPCPRVPPGATMSQPRTVRREVRSADPSLSDEANRLLTEEVRKVVGRDVVEVPAETPERHDEVHGRRSTVLGMIAANRLLFAISLAALIVVGAIVSLATGSWWALVAACAVHATGTVLIAA